MNKKTPMRMCICCREMKPKKEMLRIVRNENGIKVDTTGKLNGRGAYVCNGADCLTKLGKAKILNKVFSCEIEPSVYRSIEEELLGNQK